MRTCAWLGSPGPRALGRLVPKPTPSSPGRVPPPTSVAFAAGRGRRIAEMRRSAQAEIDEAGAEALSGMRGDVSSLAVGAAQIVLGRDLDAGNQQSVIDQALSATEGDDHDRNLRRRRIKQELDPRRSQRALLGLGCVPHHRRGVRHERRARHQGRHEATSAKVEGELAEAEQAKAEAEAELGLTSSLGDAGAEAEAIIADARDQATRLEADLIARAENDVAEAKERARIEVAAQRDQALADLRAAVAEQARVAADAVVRSSLDDSPVRTDRRLHLQRRRQLTAERRPSHERHHRRLCRRSPRCAASRGRYGGRRRDPALRQALEANDELRNTLADPRAGRHPSADR